MAFRVASTALSFDGIAEHYGERQYFGASEICINYSAELGDYFHNHQFNKCSSMGQLVKRQLKQTLQKNLKLIQKNLGKFED